MIRLSIDGGVATITLDSPRNRNALSTALITELLDALATAVTDPAARVIVLTHTGPVFCSGADLKETLAAAGSGGGASGEVPAGRMGEVLAALWDAPKPVVARVGGAARAGGVGLVAAADIAVCADDVTFAFTEVRLGVIPAVISATVLPRLAPRAAAELFLTGASFDARRAADIGLVTAAVPAADLDAAVVRYAADLLRGAPTALAGTKALLRRPATADLRDQLAELTRLSVGYFTSPDGVEGISALLAKRDPSWVTDLAP
jgi:methylglutaconyl-CoA hydratase